MQISNYWISIPDIVIIGLILFFCIFGFARGVIRQFFSIIAFLLASVASIAIPYFVNLPTSKDVSPVWGFIILSILVWVPSFLIFNSIGKFIAKKMTKKGIKISDRLWGFAFGGIKGLMIITVFVFFIDIFPAEIRSAIPFAPRIYDESKIVNIIEPYNPLLKIKIMQNLQLLVSAMNDPEYMDLLMTDPEFQKLEQQKSIQAIVNSPDMKEILDERQYIKFITDPKIIALLKDEEAMKLLLSIDVDKKVIDNI